MWVQVVDGLQYDVTKAKFLKVRRSFDDDYTRMATMTDSYYSSLVMQIEPPIVVEGIMCASTRFNAREHECRPLPTPPSEVSLGSSSSSEEGGEEVEGECPLCTYLKASPCRDVFLPFKECLDSAADTDEQEDLRRCEPQAVKLHECILEHKLFSGQEGEEGTEEEGTEEEAKQ